MARVRGGGVEAFHFFFLWFCHLDLYFSQEHITTDIASLTNTHARLACACTRAHTHTHTHTHTKHFTSSGYSHIFLPCIWCWTAPSCVELTEHPVAVGKDGAAKPWEPRGWGCSLQVFIFSVQPLLWKNLLVIFLLVEMTKVILADSGERFKNTAYVVWWHLKLKGEKEKSDWGKYCQY